jgi:segregation and condensation protein B
MEENLEQEQQQQSEQPEQKAEVKAEQYNKPKDVRLPLPGSLQEIVGALLFASESPLSAADIRACVRGVSPEDGDSAEIMEVYKTCTNREIEEALRGLEKALEVAKCGFSLVCTGGQYRMQTTPVCGRYVRALLKLDRPNRLSRASLETLAIVAYRQPITKSEVEQIRGVSVDTIMKTLSDLGLVRLVGRSELPGHPFLYGTTPFFLEHFGLARYFDLICGALMHPPKGYGKADVIKDALDRSNITNLEGLVMVGDRLHDVEGAHKIGLPAIGVLYGYGDRPELENAGAEYIAEDIYALGQVLLNEN